MQVFKAVVVVQNPYQDFLATYSNAEKKKETGGRRRKRDK